MPDYAHAAALVESPLQLLAAIEAHAAGLGGDHTRMLVRDRVPGLLAARADLEAAGLPAGLTMEGADSRAALRVKEPVQLVGDAFSGRYQSAAATHRAPQRTVLLDDGLGTVEMARLLAEGRPLLRLGQDASLHRRFLAACATRRLLRTRADGAVVLFTAIPLAPEIGTLLRARGVDLQTCDFSWLRSTALPPAPAEPTVVLGSALAADGWIHDWAYHSWVRDLAREGVLRYFPHRREAPESVAQIAKLPGVEIAQPGGPVELRLRGMTSQRLVSLPSTASVLLTRLLAGRAVRIQPHDVPDHWWTQAAPPALRNHLRLVLELTEAAAKDAA